MEKTKFIFKRYAAFFALAFLLMVLYWLKPEIGQSSLKITVKNTGEMLKIIPPVFILLGLLDVWVKRETMIKYMGEDSGFKGVLIAFLLGSAAAGPLYAAFPIAGILLKKGSKLTNVFIFIGAWSTTKIPMFLLEASYLGMKFAVVRLLLSLIGIAIITVVTEKSLKASERNEIFDRALLEQ